ncbi:MAG TPA: lipoate--protein ligase family protein [Candidatus Thermoplasmatota archaeon]|nr:lipoate--protein ligase family protein [Candidatus Thermoplasmatota archaeon]
MARLVLDGHLPARENMARDEALLARGEPAVRLYGWRPAAVSLGRSQRARAVDGRAAAAFGVDVVQRATGGGAILHNEAEVTYAVVVPLDHPGLPRDIPGSFRFLSQGVLHALHALGLPAVVESVEGPAVDALCYVREQGTNVLVGGRKISGGAQRRTPSAVLQHGTVIVRRDAARMAALLRADPAVVRERVTSLAAEGVFVTRERVVEALIEGFEKALGPLER